MKKISQRALRQRIDIKKRENKIKKLERENIKIEYQPTGYRKQQYLQDIYSNSTQDINEFYVNSICYFQMLVYREPMKFPHLKLVVT